MIEPKPPSLDPVACHGDEPVVDRPFITLDEAAALFGVSPRTARRWAADYVNSHGAFGIPVIRVSKRRWLVAVGKLLDLAPGDRPPDQTLRGKSPKEMIHMEKHQQQRHHTPNSITIASMGSDAGLQSRMALIDRLLEATPTTIKVVEEALAWAEYEGQLDD